MTLLNRYIFRRILVPFTAGTTILLLTLSLERFLRLIEDVSAYDVPLWNVLGLLLYLMPHYLGLAIPAALFFSVFLALRGLHEESAIPIIRAAGIPQEALLKPVLSFSLLIMLVLLSLVWWLQPHSRYDYRQNLHILKSQTRLKTITPATFMEIGDDLVLRAETYESATGKMTGFFTAHTPDSGKNTYITAKTARLVDYDPDAALDALTIALQNGRLVKTGAVNLGTDKNVLPVTFTDYSWQPAFITPAAYGPRGTDERELTLGELQHGGLPGVQLESPPAETKAEFHARLVQVASLPFLALLAMPLAFIGGGRTGKANGLVLGVVMLISYEKTLGVAENLAEKGAPSHVAFYLWGTLALLISSALILYGSRSDGVRFFLQKFKTNNPKTGRRTR